MIDKRSTNGVNITKLNNIVSIEKGLSIFKIEYYEFNF